MSREISHLWREVEAWLDALPFAPSQAKLAERLGLKSRTVISDWKYGASRPTPEHLQALAREMELTEGPGVYRRLLEAVNRDQGYVVHLSHGSGKTMSVLAAAGNEVAERRTSTASRQMLMEQLADDRDPEYVKFTATDLLRGGLMLPDDVDAVMEAAERATERRSPKPKAARKMASAGRAARAAQDAAAEAGEAWQDDGGEA